MAAKPNALDRAILALAPRWGASRLRARVVANVLARHYEAASLGRRTQHWNRSKTDANAALGASLPALREFSRDLERNNAWAHNALAVIEANVVGAGIVPKFSAVRDVWHAWAETTECDADGRRNFYGLQALVTRSVARDGEVVIRRRWRRQDDGLTIPLQLQVLEADFIDLSKDGFKGASGGEVIQGVEFDAIGRPSAYWLFDRHPGSGKASTSYRVPATEIIHVFRDERAGQVHAAPWLAPVVLNLKEFDEFEDAILLKKKIEACFAAFVTDVDGGGAALGESDPAGGLVETLEPGLVSYLPPGKDVKFSTPQPTGDDGFSERTLRRIAAGIGVTYEDMTGDYSRVNYSAGRMGWHRHWNNVERWRWNMLIPQFCDRAWAWAMEAAVLAGKVQTAPAPEWTPPPKPMLDPDKEGLSYVRRVRSGQMTPSEMVREQGRDPQTHWQEYADDMKRLDALGILLDSDPRKMTQAGQAQAAQGSATAPANPKPYNQADSGEPDEDEAASA